LLGDLLAGVAWGALTTCVDLPPGAGRIINYAEFLGAETTICWSPSRRLVARRGVALGRGS
jgi:hypothetical protein